MRCPNCGSEVRTPRAGSQYLTTEDMERIVRNQKWGGITCDNCPAVMTISYSQSEPFVVASFLFVVIGVVTSVALYALGAAILVLALAVVLAIVFTASLVLAHSKRKLEITAMRPACQYCGIVMETENASFCPKCGASMVKGVRGRPQDVARMGIPASQRIGTCMVCNLGLEANDLLAWCPHCGSAAHRNHLLEWLHVKNKCPKCSQHIDEREINLRTLGERANEGKQKRIWRTV